MSTTFPYNASAYDPPAPVLRATVGAPGAEGSSPVEEVWGLCDTGADLTCLPKSVAERLRLIAVDEVAVALYDGPPQLKPVYAAQMKVGEASAKTVRVICLERNETILGRDLLNLLRLELDGPARTVTLRPRESA